jgi:DNA helicase HerA-like ATPase
LNELVVGNQLTIIDLSESEEGISEIIVAAVCRSIFDSRKRHSKGEEKGLSTPTFIVVEEAHTFAPRAYTDIVSPSRNILRKIAREGRKFGVGLCIISQRPNKLDADVLSQCNTQIIMKIVNPSDQEYIRQSVETITEDIVKDLPGLMRGEAVIAGSAIKIPVSVKIRPRETIVGGSDLDIVGIWNKA